MQEGVHSANMPSHAFILELSTIDIHQRNIRYPIRNIRLRGPRLGSMDTEVQKVHRSHGYRVCDGSHRIRLPDLRI